MVNTEAIAELSQEAYNFAGIVDVSDLASPRLISVRSPSPFPLRTPLIPTTTLAAGGSAPTTNITTRATPTCSSPTSWCI